MKPSEWPHIDDKEVEQNILYAFGQACQQLKTINESGRNRFEVATVKDLLTIMSLAIRLTEQSDET